MKSLFKFKALVALLLIAFVSVSCTQPEDSSKKKSSNTPVAGSTETTFDTFVGTWENNDYDYHSEYKIAKDKISDAMNCEYQVLTETLVKSTDGYYFIFTKCIKGTEYTPEGNFFAIAVKLDVDNKLHIICPMDYTETFTSLEALQERYTTSSNIGMNFETVCTKM